MLGREGVQRFLSQTIKVRQQRFRLGRINLVDRVKDRFADPAQEADDLLVAGTQALSAVHEEDQDVGLADGELRLSADERQHALGGGGIKAARVHQSEGTALISSVGVVAVPRDPRHIVHDGIPGSQHAVEQCGFADVGPPDDGNHRGK